jgi:hypothetical protein
MDDPRQDGRHLVVARRVQGLEPRRPDALLDEDPSGTRVVWKWTFKLSVPPNRWMAVTPPVRGSAASVRRADRRCQAKTVRVKMASPRPA